MRVAVTVWEDRVSPVFDSARVLLVARIENGMIADRFYEPVNLSLVSRALEFLQQNHITKVICGAVSQESIALIENYGIELFPFITGKVEVILDRFAKGEELENFAMPGCWCQCPRCPNSGRKKNGKQNGKQSGRKNGRQARSW
ncbi:MAG: hypothetical protein CSB24_00740 [Deltaproteobacteria bacterium]|nr:MAG: hypothetical protein CSB24_00740 [Deltaproteobacteria bacterium]